MSEFKFENLVLTGSNVNFSGVDGHLGSWDVKKVYRCDDLYQAMARVIDIDYRIRTGVIICEPCVDIDEVRTFVLYCSKKNFSVFVIGVPITDTPAIFYRNIEEFIENNFTKPAEVKDFSLSSDELDALLQG